MKVLLGLYYTWSYAEFEYVINPNESGVVYPMKICTHAGNQCRGSVEPRVSERRSEAVLQHSANLRRHP